MLYITLELARMSYDPDEGYDIMPYEAFACLRCGAIVHDTDIHDTWHHEN